MQIHPKHHHRRAIFIAAFALLFLLFQLSFRSEASDPAASSPRGISRVSPYNEGNSTATAEKYLVPRTSSPISDFPRRTTTSMAPLGAACRVNSCSARKQRGRSVGVLFDVVTGRSDVEPQVHLSDLRSILKKSGYRDELRDIVWPSTNEPSAGSVSPSPGSSGLQYVECTRRNLIIGLATSLKQPFLQPFVSSFQRYHGPCDDMVLFVDDPNMPLILDRDKATVQLESFEEWLRKTPAAQVEGQQMSVRRIPVMSHYLQSRWRRYHFIVHCDTRDTIFFDSVFDGLDDLAITGLFSVTESRPFTSCALNRQWVDLYSGSRYLSGYIASLQLHGRPIDVICSGIYGGTSAAMIDYLNAFDLSSRRLKRDARSTLGIDQGIHHYLQLFGLPLAGFPHPILVLDHTVGPARHWYPRGTAVIRDNMGRHVNCNFKPYAIVHQLDRWDQLWRDAFSDYAVPPPLTTQQLPCDTAHGGAQGSDDARAYPPFFTPFVTKRPRVNVTVPLSPTEVPHSHTHNLLTTRCIYRNVILIVALLSDPDLLQPLLASLQRFHTVCDDLVVFVPHNIDKTRLAMLSVGTHVSVDWKLVHNPTTTTATHIIETWLTLHQQSKKEYRYVMILEETPTVGITIFGNVFSSERTGEGLWLMDGGSSVDDPPLLVDPSEAVRCFGGTLPRKGLSLFAFGGTLTAVADYVFWLSTTMSAVPPACRRHLKLIRERLVVPFLRSKRSGFPHTVDVVGPTLTERSSSAVGLSTPRCRTEKRQPKKYLIVLAAAPRSGAFYSKWQSQYRKRGPGSHAFFATTVEGRFCSR